MKRIAKTILAVILIAALLSINAAALTPSYTVSSAYKKSIYYQQLINVELTGNQAQDIVNVALSQKDYHEGNSTADFGGGNTSGTGNYTEYGYWFGTQFNWCAVFISWCARQAGIPESVIKTNSMASGAQCHFGEKKYSFGTREAQVGDILYIDNDSDPEADHVALVYKVDSTYIYTIEGNTSQKVYALKYYKDTGVQTYYSTTKILFYGVPNYQNSSSGLKKGDINGDGLINSVDALFVLEHCVSRRTLTKNQLSVADMNGDGKINSKDSLEILKYSTNTLK